MKGRGAVRQWIKLRERNEALDLEIYALAALYIMGEGTRRSLAERAAQLALPIEPAPPAKVEPQGMRLPSAFYRPRRTGWVDSWRR